eukprot:TRINITY_DN112070_c0_g1_i1.p2 TRINITY_DN112070_c0_g1~~TRINITY_DN112070_c0_g1_i1.p2  ORF type:complete len:106 (-),score=24.88 TRINITY_DN112070_c0_g1_i1:315-632(-)
MDVIAQGLRGGLTGFRSSLRAARRKALETIYVVKEAFFKNYDFVHDTVRCKRRVKGPGRHTSAFRYESFEAYSERNPQRPIYDFTELQHGVESSNLDWSEIKRMQ